MNLFIDTNIFLSFYHLASDDLEELRKLGVLLQKEELALYIPEQVIDEFKRNRDNKISDALKRLREQKLNLQFPQMCKDYPEYNVLRDHQKKYEEAHSELMKKLSKDISESSLKADGTIEELFSRGTKISSTEKIIDKAKLRHSIGNPPGKEGSLGDAINWEALIASLPEGEDLYFITDDSDYCSSIDSSHFNSYLAEEWTIKKNSSLIFYKKLSGFFKDKFPDIKLASELEKELLIRDLEASGTFARTHSVVAKLNKYTDFTNTQINDMISAATTNSQIYWIIKDEDINEFFKKIINGKEEKLDKETLESLLDLLGTEESDTDIPYDPDDEIPF